MRLASSQLSLHAVVPVLNEAEGIEPFLRDLGRQLPLHCVTVVDGGSTDGTVSIASRHARVIPAERGRAAQMNAGAEAAGGVDVLWFVHADSGLSAGAVGRIREALADQRILGGCFRLGIEGRHPALRICDRWGNAGVNVFRIACGDHSLFVRRTVFERLGGFPDWPLMEDAEMYRRIARQGRVVQLRPFVHTSPRRWLKHGPMRTTAIYCAIMARYVTGAGSEELLRMYRRLAG